MELHLSGPPDGVPIVCVLWRTRGVFLVVDFDVVLARTRTHGMDPRTLSLAGHVGHGIHPSLFAFHVAWLVLW